MPLDGLRVGTTVSGTELVNDHPDVDATLFPQPFDLTNIAKKQPYFVWYCRPGVLKNELWAYGLWAPIWNLDD